MASSNIRLSLAFVLAAVVHRVIAQNCSPGTYSITGTTPCTQCPVGTFQADSSSTSCQEAAAGYYAAGPGAISETICGDGYYSIGGTESCTPCPDGATCVGQGNTYPTYNPTVTTDDEDDDDDYQGPGYLDDPNYDFDTDVDDGGDDDGDNIDDFDGFIDPIDLDDIDVSVDDIPTRTVSKREPKKAKKPKPSPSVVFKRATKKTKKPKPSPSTLSKRATKKTKKPKPSPSAVYKRVTKKTKQPKPSPSAVFKREPKKFKKPSPSPSAFFKRDLKKMKKPSPSPSAAFKREPKKPKKAKSSPSAVFKRATKKTKKPKASPSPVVKSESKKLKNPKPSPSVLSKRTPIEYPMLAPISSCRPGFQECPINGVLAYTDDFECVDIRNSLESCGGCVADDSPNGEYNIDGGRDCSSIPNVDRVSCAKAQCVIASCSTGYAVSADGTRCAPIF